MQPAKRRQNRAESPGIGRFCSRSRCFALINREPTNTEAWQQAPLEGTDGALAGATILIE